MPRSSVSLREPPSPIFMSWTFYSFSAHLIPDTTFHFLTTCLLQTQIHPWLIPTPCAGVPFPLSHVHYCSPHTFFLFTQGHLQLLHQLGNAFHPWNTFLVPSLQLLFSINPFIVLHLVLDSYSLQTDIFLIHPALLTSEAEPSPITCSWCCSFQATLLVLRHYLR